MGDLLTNEGLVWIINSILERTKEIVDEYGSENGDFYQGMMEAYYEVLDMIKSRIQIMGGNLKEYGLDFDLEKLESELKQR